MTDAQKALAMIERARKRGRASEVVLLRTTTGPGVYNPETGEFEAETTTETFTTIGVKVGYEQSDIDGTLIQRGDQRVYIPALGFTRPATNESLTVGGKTCTVIGVEVVAPGDADVLYVIHARGL